MLLRVSNNVATNTRSQLACCSDCLNFRTMAVAHARISNLSTCMAANKHLRNLVRPLPLIKFLQAPTLRCMAAHGKRHCTFRDVALLNGPIPCPCPTTSAQSHWALASLDGSFPQLGLPQNKCLQYDSGWFEACHRSKPASHAREPQVNKPRENDTFGRTKDKPTLISGRKIKQQVVSIKINLNHGIKET